ncbi:MAG TPA: hypothetical protein VH413_16430 [Verrucomicrobiae bacterium]|nr:hypothetical protein [Verrucomicrobiae bacterium]
MNNENSPAAAVSDRAAANPPIVHKPEYYLGAIASVSGLERSGKLNAKVALKQIRSILTEMTLHAK